MGYEQKSIINILFKTIIILILRCYVEDHDSIDQ